MTNPQHKLVNDTLTIEDSFLDDDASKKGVVARCTCGWTSGLRISSMCASAAFEDHVEEATGQ